MNDLLKQVLAYRLPLLSAAIIAGSAYGSEQMLLVLAAVDRQAYTHLGILAVAVLCLLVITTINFMQLLSINPHTGWYDIVASRLGQSTAATAAAALLIAGMLLAAVSISAGTMALTAILPVLSPHISLFNVTVLAALVLVVGLRQTCLSCLAGIVLFFVAVMLAIILTGCYQAAISPLPAMPPQSLAQQWDWERTLTILQAFAAGSSAVAGLTLIASLPSSSNPHAVQASIITVYSSSALLALPLIGVPFFILHFHLLPINQTTVLSQISELLFGRGLLYYVISISTVLLLYSTALAALSRFPYAQAILICTNQPMLTYRQTVLFSGLLTSLFMLFTSSNLPTLIACYVVAAFIVFAIIQISLAIYWNKKCHPARMTFNMLGALVSIIVAATMLSSHFLDGAWLAPVLIMFVLILKKRWQFRNT